jgi:hypothetical protein
MNGSVDALLRTNLAFAWIWILCGFISGALMGMRFKDERWLGGYTSFPRRLYRLGHISFFALGALNWMFAVTARSLAAPLGMLSVAAWALIVGGALMPLCCYVMAHHSKAKPALLFAAPVSSLVVGAALTLRMILFP